MSNIAVILLALLVGFVIIKQYILTRATAINPTPAQIVSNVEQSPGRTTPTRASPIGMTIPLEGVNWTEKKQTLVLYLSTTCRYCNESVPFYQKLIKAKSEKDFEIVAILSQNPEEAKSYLRTQGLNIGQVFSSSLSSVGVTATPTLLLVNQEGVVSDFWRGKLNPDKEAEVLAKLSG